SQVVDVLIRGHLETIAEHLADRNVAMALNMGEQLPAPYRERLLRTLFIQGSDRQTRGRMGLVLGRYLKSLAQCVERLNQAGTKSQQQWELMFLDPAFVDQIRKADQKAIERRAEEVLEQVSAHYGDVAHLNGMIVTTETLASVAARELAEVRSFSVGQKA